MTVRQYLLMFVTENRQKQLHHYDQISEGRRRAWKIRKRCQGSRSRAKDMAARKFHFKFLIMRNCVE